MNALIKNLMSKEPFYVRCIKPNDSKSSTLFDDERVANQVRYMGLLENVQVRRAGFVYRRRYDQFLRRYKMISEYTWPNFRSGNAKQGTKVLIRDSNFENDVRYGKTKLFIRSPSTLLALERQRNSLIPGIVIFLQKNWRGAICRQRYRKMRAAHHLVLMYRRHKVYKYFADLTKLFRVAAIKAPGYGRGISWPQPPIQVRHLVPKLRDMFNRWRAWKILSKIAVKDLDQIRLKVYALSAIDGHRKSCGLNRPWEGNYLARETENNYHGRFSEMVDNLRQSHYFEKVIFSSFMKKFNRHNRMSDRVLFVTEHCVYKMTMLKFQLLNKGVPIQQVTFFY